MSDAQPTLLPPTSGYFFPVTPSGLTPNTRSEAEAALLHNSTAQTDSAAPTTPLRPVHGNKDLGMGAGGGNNTLEGEVDDGVTEAQKAYRRPVEPIRTSSTNYEKALREAHDQASVSSDLSTDSIMAGRITDTMTESPVSTTVPFPLPRHGVVPLRTGVGSGQAEVVKKARPSGLSLGDLGRKQSWNEQDMKHVLQGRLMGPVKGDAGYDSGTEDRAVGPRGD